MPWPRCGNSQIWMKTGIVGTTVFAMQWDELTGAVEASVVQLRSFQVIEITANANLLAAQVSQAADDLVAAYTDVIGLVATVDVISPDSVLLFAAGIAAHVPGSDDCAAYQFFEGGTPEGPEVYVFTDNVTNGCGHSLYHATTGKSAGSHTFSVRGQIVNSFPSLATDRNRSLAILELFELTTAVLTGSVAPSSGEAEIVAGGKTIILTLSDDQWVAAGATFDAVRQDLIDGLLSDGVEAAGWNVEVQTAIPVGNVVRTSDTVVTITLPAVAGYGITANETIEATIDAGALVVSAIDVVAAPTFTIIDDAALPAAPRRHKIIAAVFGGSGDAGARSR